MDDEKALTARVTEVLRGKVSPGREPTFTPEQVAAVVALAIGYGGELGKKYRCGILKTMTSRASGASCSRTAASVASA